MNECIDCHLEGSRFLICRQAAHALRLANCERSSLLLLTWGEAGEPATGTACKKVSGLQQAIISLQYMYTLYILNTCVHYIIYIWIYTHWIYMFILRVKLCRHKYKIYLSIHTECICVYIYIQIDMIYMYIYTICTCYRWYMTKYNIM